MVPADRYRPARWSRGSKFVSRGSALPRARSYLTRRRPSPRGRARGATRSDVRVGVHRRLSDIERVVGSPLQVLAPSTRGGEKLATVLPGLKGDLTIPTTSVEPTAGWQSTEATAISASTPTLRSLAFLCPKSVIALVEYSPPDEAAGGGARRIFTVASPRAKSAASSTLSGFGVQRRERADKRPGH